MATFFVHLEVAMMKYVICLKKGLTFACTLRRIKPTSKQKNKLHANKGGQQNGKQKK